MQYDEIPRRPVTHILLLKIRMDKDKLIQLLRLQYRMIPKDGWMVIKKEEHQVNS